MSPFFALSLLYPGKTPILNQPISLFLYSHSEWTSNAGEKPQSSANWNSTNTKSLGLPEPSTLCTTSLEFSHLAFSTSPTLHLCLPSQYKNLLSLHGKLTTPLCFCSTFLPSLLSECIHFSFSYIFNISHCLLFLFLPFNNKTCLNPSQLNKNNPYSPKQLLVLTPSQVSERVVYTCYLHSPWNC